MTFQRQNQRVSATEILQAVANGEEIRLEKCSVSGALDLNRLFIDEEKFNLSGIVLQTQGTMQVLSFCQPLVFNTCIFEDNVTFAPPWDKPGTIEAVFEKDVVFNMSTFAGQSRFSGAVFRGLAGFDGCIFKHVVCFQKAVFESRAMFRTVEFDGHGLFTGAVFHTDARFTNSSFGRGATFTSVRFNGKTDFSGVYSKSKSVPVYDSIRFEHQLYGDDETFWRFIKQVSQEAGYYQLAGESFYNERCSNFRSRLRGPDYDKLSLRQKTIKILSGVKLLPELILGRYLFGYGERPVRVLAVALLLILLCAFFYNSSFAGVAYKYDQSGEELSFMDCLYFSTITFTTLGFGDMHPVRTAWLTRCVAMFEAFSGACLMALFVVGLSNRFSKG